MRKIGEPSKQVETVGLSPDGYREGRSLSFSMFSLWSYYMSANWKALSRLRKIAGSILKAVDRSLANVIVNGGGGR